MKMFAETNWHFWHIRQRPPLLIYLFYYGAATRAIKAFPHYVYTSGQCCDRVITKKEELEGMRRKEWNKLKEDSGFVLRFMKDMYKLNGKDVKEWHKLLFFDYAKKTNMELKRFYAAYIKKLLAYSPAIYLPLALEPVLIEQVEKLFHGKNSSKARAWYDCVMTPVRESEIIEERKSLLRLAIKMKRRKLIVAAMERHIERFSFLKRKDMFMEFYSEKYYSDKIKKCGDPFKELDRLEKETKKKKMALREILNAFQDNAFARDMIKMTNEAIFFRTWRTERFSQSTFYVVGLFGEVAKRLGLDRHHDVLWFLPEEIEYMLTNEKTADKKLMERRQQAFTAVWFGRRRELLLLQGEKARESLNYLKFFNMAATAELRGQSAYRGNIIGEVTLIANRSEWPRIRKDRKVKVLVIHTTTPDIVPYLKNVQAIVTEEGGILSHASVISRELKIPCVIGTKIATRIFKDGDMVEVDAEQGIVRKI